MSTEQLQVNFRMPARLKAQLEVEAFRSGRSLTAEIVQRLQDSLAGDTADGPAVKAAVNKLVEAVSAYNAVVMGLIRDVDPDPERHAARVALVQQLTGHDLLQEAGKKIMEPDSKLREAAAKMVEEEAAKYTQRRKK